MGLAPKYISNTTLQFMLGGAIMKIRRDVWINVRVCISSLVIQMFCFQGMSRVRFSP